MVRFMKKNENEYKLIHVKEADEFIGIKIDGNIIEIYVPEIYRESTNFKQSRQEILMFLKSISLTNAKSNANIKSSDNDLVGEMWPIESYVWIIKDYLENGYFYNREKKYFNDGKGKIDWKRTLKSSPIYSNGNIIYNKLVTFRVSATNDIIAQIYKLCLSVSLKRIGWIFNYKFKVDIQQYISNKEMIYHVKKELDSTFDDVKRLRFRHMLKILNGIKEDNVLSDRSTYGIKNYYYVVEQMIDKMFMGIDNKRIKSKFNPIGNWQLENGEEKNTRILRPDTIYEAEDKVYIIDSKMYKYGYTANINDLPQTSDILKQIAYGDFIKNKLGYVNVRNVFIIPYNKELDLFKYNEDFVYIGVASGKWINPKKIKSHQFIYTFLLDYMHLLMNYNKHDSSNIEKMCNTVENLLSKQKIMH